MEGAPCHGGGTAHGISLSWDVAQPCAIMMDPIVNRIPSFIMFSSKSNVENQGESDSLNGEFEKYSAMSAILSIFCLSSKTDRIKETLMTGNKLLSTVLQVKGMRICDFEFRSPEMDLRILVKPHKNGCRCPKCGKRGSIVRSLDPRAWRVHH